MRSRLYNYTATPYTNVDASWTAHLALRLLLHNMFLASELRRMVKPKWCCQSLPSITPINHTDMAIFYEQDPVGQVLCLFQAVSHM